MLSKNERLSKLRQRRHELEGFRNPSPGAMRELADLIRKMQAIHEEAQEDALP